MRSEGRGGSLWRPWMVFRLGPQLPSATHDVERVTTTYHLLGVIDTTDGEQALLLKVPRDAPLDGDGEDTVPRPEGDDGVTHGGRGIAV